MAAAAGRAPLRRDLAPQHELTVQLLEGQLRLPAAQQSRRPVEHNGEAPPRAEATEKVSAQMMENIGTQIIKDAETIPTATLHTAA